MNEIVALEKLAAEIRAEHRKATASAINALEHAIIAGRLLVQAKAAVAHGEWLPWLVANCPDISVRSVQGYIRLANKAPALLADPNTQRVSHLGVREALNMVADHRPLAAESPGPDLSEPTIERDGFELHDDQFLSGVKENGRKTVQLFIFPDSANAGFFFVNRVDSHGGVVEGTEKPLRRDAVLCGLKDMGVGDTLEFEWESSDIAGGYNYNFFLYSSYEHYVDAAILGH